MLDTNQAMELGTETMKMARIAGMEYADATDYMTATLRGFNMELNQMSAQRVNDVYSELAAVTASNTQEIAEAMTKTASIANSAGMSFEVTATLLAKAIETTREAPENIGTAMKTVVARFTEMKKSMSDLVETSDGETVSVNRVEKALKSAGVELRNQAGEFRSLDDVFLELSQRWNTLDVMSQRYIATQAAGSRQQSRFIAMMDNYARTQELLSHATNSAGASNTQYEKTMDSLEAKLNQLKNAWDTFTMDIARSDLIKGVVDLLTNLLTAVNNLTGAFGSFSGVAKLVTAFLGFKMVQPIIVGLTADMVNFAKTMAGAGEAQKGFEGGLAKGFSNLKNTLFKKETWFYEGREAGAAASQGFQKGVQEAEQASSVAENVVENIAENTQENFKQIENVVELTTDKTKEYKKNLEKLSEEAELSGKKINKLASYYTVNGEAVKFLNAEEKERVKLLKESGLSWEEAITQTLKERTQVIQDNTKAQEKQNQEEENVIGNIQEQGEQLSELIENLENHREAQDGDTNATEINTGANRENENQIQLGILTRAKYYATLLFGTKVQRDSAAETLNAAGANEAYTASLSKATIAIGWYAAAAAAIIAVTKVITDFHFLEEKRLKKEKLERLESVKAIYEETDAIKEQQSSYEEALNSYDETIESKRKYKDATLELAEALGVEVKASDLLASNTEKINRQLQEATKLKYEQSKKVAEQAKQDAEDLIYDAKWNMENHGGALRNIGLGLLNDFSLFLYGKQSYNEYEQQLEDNQKNLEEASEKLKEYTFKYTFVQSQMEAGISTGAETFEQYKDFRTKLEENLIQFGLNEEEIQHLLTSELTNNETAFEVALLAEREFIKRLNDFGISIDDFELQEFLKQVRDEKGTTSLANIKLIGIDDIEKLKEVYKWTKEIDDRIESLKIGEKTASVIEQLASGETFDSLDENLVREFNSELLETEGIYDNLITAQQEWNNLVSNGSSEAGKLKYLLKLQEKILDKRQKEKVQLKQEREDRRKELEDERKRLNVREESFAFLYQQPAAQALKTSGLNVFSSLRKRYQEGELTKKDVASVYNNELDKLIYHDFWDTPLGPKYQSQTLETLAASPDFRNYLSKNEAIYKNIGDLLNINFQSLDLENAKSYLERANQLSEDLNDNNSDLVNLLNSYSPELIDSLRSYLPSLITTLEGEGKYLEAFENFNADFDSLNLEDKWDNLELRNLIVQKAELEQVTFNSDNLKAINDLILKAGSGEDIGELDDNIKNFLDLLPSVSGGFNSALEEYLYSISYRSSQEIKDFFEEISKAGIEQIQKNSLKELDTDRQSLAYNKDYISAIEEEWGGSSGFGLSLGLGDSAELYEIMSAIVNLSDEEYNNLLNENTAYKDLIKKAKSYMEAQSKISTLTAKISKTDYGLKNATEQVKIIDSNIDTLASTIDALSELLSKIGEDFTLSAEDARKFADVFPEILKNATVTSDGIVHLNQATVGSFIQGKKDEVQTDVDAINSRIDNAIQILKAKKEINEREQESFNDFVKNYANKDDNLKNYLMNNSDILYEHIRNSGAQEVVDTYEFLRQDNSKWSQYLSGVDEMNKSFYSNVITYKKLADKGIDINNINLNNLKIVASGKDEKGGNAGRKYYYGKTQISSDVYDKIVSFANKNKTDYKGTVNSTTLQDVLDGLDESNKGKDTIDEESWQDFVDKMNKIFEEQGIAYEQQIKILEAAQVNLSSLGNLGKNLKPGGTDGKEEDKFENTLDKLYNLLQELETETEQLQKLENDYNVLLKKRNVTGKEIYENLKDQIKVLNQQKATQKAIAAGRAKEIEGIFKEIPALKNYVTYDNKTGKIEVDQNALNKITNKEFGDKILDGINRLEDAEQKRQDANNAIYEINEQIKEIKERGIEEYISLENRTLEAIKKQRQDVIDHLSEVNNSINEANSKLMETVRENINKIRQDRQNEKTQNEISDLQGQLAAMAARTDVDTETNKEYLNLQKSLKEKTESYQDTLIDQKLTSMEEDNKKAQEQRERQIKLLEKHLQIDEESGILMTQAQELLNNAIGPKGTLIKTSDLVQLLKSTENYKGLSNIERMKWLEDFEKSVALGSAGISNRNQIENQRTKAGTKITFADGAGNQHTGVTQKNGDVKVSEKGKTYTYSDVYRNEAGQYRTFETLSSNSTSNAAPTTKNNSKSSHSEKDYYGVALATLNGNYGWGTGEERTKKYKEKGLDSEKIQNLINSGLAAKNPYGIKDLSQYDYKKFYTGGLADYTGLAWLDGTKSNPEAVLNSAQTKAFISLIDNQRKLLESGNTTNIGGQTNIEVSVNVDKIASDYDVQQMVNIVKQEIVNICGYRNDNTLNYLR